jgi:hypothetical protein
MPARRLLAVVAVVLGLGCSEKGDPISSPPLPIPPELKGRWSGIATGQLSMTFSLSQTRRAISGSAVITSLVSGQSSSGTISGTNNFPTFYMSLTIPGFIPIVITGHFTSATAVSAQLNDSGFSNFPITIIKQ